MIRPNSTRIFLAVALLFHACQALTVTGFVRSTTPYVTSFERTSSEYSLLRPARQSIILAAEPRKEEIDIDAVKKEADDALKAAEAALAKGPDKEQSSSTKAAKATPASTPSPSQAPPSTPRPPEIKPETTANLDPKVVAASKAFQKAAAEFQVDAISAAVGGAILGGTVGVALVVEYPSLTMSVDPSVPPLAGATLLAGSALAIGLQDSRPGRIVRNILGKPTKAIGNGIAKSIKNSVDKTVDRIVSFPGYIAEQTKKKVETTVQEIEAFPGYVAEQTKKKVETTVQVIESDIKAFPKKVSEAAIDAAEDLKEEIIATPGRLVEGTKESVRKTVEGTKQAVKNKTKETKEKIVKSVEEVVSIPTKTVESIASLLEGEKRDPEVPKPPRLPPPEEVIRQGSNQVRFPGLAAPKLQRDTASPQTPPKVQSQPKPSSLPTFDVSKIEIPKVEVPRVEIPKVEVPRVEIPKIDIPKIDIPKVKIPATEEGASAPAKPQKSAKKGKIANEGAQVTASVKALMAELATEKKISEPTSVPSIDSTAERRRKEEENRKQKEAQQAERARLALEQKQKQEEANAQKAAERARAAELQRQQQEERRRQNEAQQAERERLALEQKQKQEEANAKKAAERARAAELQRQQQEERIRQQEAKKQEAEAKRAAQQARQEEQNRKLEQQRAEQAEKRRAAAEAARAEAERRQQEQARRREEQLKASQREKQPKADVPRPSFLLGTPSQKTTSAAPRGVPTIAYWRKRTDNGISGKIYGSPNFKDGERIETSKITFGQIENGSVVKTSSGSRYFLSSAPPAPGKAEKALESAKPGATINLSNIFNGNTKDVLSQKTKPRSAQATAQTSTTFSLFGNSRSSSIAPNAKQSPASISVKAESPPRATFSLFGLGGGQAEPETTTSTESKVNGSKPSAPRGVPTLKNWRKNGDKSVTGNISGSPNFKTNEKVTTSPIVKGNIASGEVVTTGSGSRYFLN